MTSTTTIPIASTPTSDSDFGSPETPRVHKVTGLSLLSDEVPPTASKSNESEETIIGQPYIVRSPRPLQALKSGAVQFTLLQKWEGVVLEANDESFTSRLIDSHGELPPQHATIPNDELSPEEQNQIAVGASFVWTIGYQHIGATRQRNSVIYFRRLPSWNQSEFDAARRRAEELAETTCWK